jgi:hypothetical protein
MGDFSCAPSFKVNAKISSEQIVSNLLVRTRIDSSQIEFIAKSLHHRAGISVPL